MFLEASFCVSAGTDETVFCIVVELLDEFWCEVVDRFMGTFGVEPVDPFEGFDFDHLAVAPGAEAFDQFGLVEADGGLGQGVVIGVANGPDRGIDPSLDESVGECK